MNINKRGLGGGGLVVDENIDLWRGSPYWANIPGEANFLLVFLMDHGLVCVLGFRTLATWARTAPIAESFRSNMNLTFFSSSSLLLVPLAGSESPKDVSAVRITEETSVTPQHPPTPQHPTAGYGGKCVLSSLLIIFVKLSGG